MCRIRVCKGDRQKKWELFKTKNYKAVLRLAANIQIPVSFEEFLNVAEQEFCVVIPKRTFGVEYTLILNK